MIRKKTTFIFPYTFIPGNRYVVKIASNVQINQPSEQFTESSELGIVLGKIYLKILRTNFENKIRTPSEHWLTIAENTRPVLYSVTEYRAAPINLVDRLSDVEQHFTKIKMIKAYIFSTLYSTIPDDAGDELNPGFLTSLIAASSIHMDLDTQGVLYV